MPEFDHLVIDSGAIIRGHGMGFHKIASVNMIVIKLNPD